MQEIYQILQSIMLGGIIGYIYGYVFFILRNNINSFMTSFAISVLRIGILSIILFYLLPSNPTNFILLSASFIVTFLIVVFTKAS